MTSQTEFTALRLASQKNCETPLDFERDYYKHDSIKELFKTVD